MSIDAKNLQTNINAQQGGSETVTIASNVGQGPDQPCRYCRLQSRSGNGVVRVRRNSVCTQTTGIALMGYPSFNPFNVHNLNQLYFWGATDDNVVDIDWNL